ncbi:antidote protein [Stenotrophomonas phage CUB19]|nr:antidote protein [Stenotrophomonas phage CUB19]
MSASPGEILLAEFIDPMRLSFAEVAEKSDLPVGVIYEIVDGTISIDYLCAQRLAKAFNTSTELWINLQRQYDQAVAK